MSNRDSKWRILYFIALCGITAYAIAMTIMAYNRLPAVIRLHLGMIVPADTGPKQSIVVIPLFNVIICLMLYVQYLRAGYSYASKSEKLVLTLALIALILLVVAEKTVIVANTTASTPGAYVGATLCLLIVTFLLAAVTGIVTLRHGA
ncbi:MAG TPA: hypothetical protein VGZ02_05150 [Candidatus Baltobacteraceae bacterium]|nr:hypothetical protein [Candidatus Baltobacteraceae bacterium]